MPLDNLDFDILNFVSSNGTLKFGAIAKALNVSSVTIHNRIKKLRKLKIIMGSVFVLDFKKLGYGVTVIVNAQLSPKHLDQTAERWAKHSNVLSVYRVTGEYDLVVVAKFKSTDELDKFNKEITSDRDILRTNTSLVFSIQKEGVALNRLELKKIMD